MSLALLFINYKSFSLFTTGAFSGARWRLILLLISPVINNDKPRKCWLRSWYNRRWVRRGRNRCIKISEYKEVGVELSAGELIYLPVNWKQVWRSWIIALQKECENLGLDAFYRTYIHRMQRSFLSVILCVQAVVIISHIAILLFYNIVRFRSGLWHEVERKKREGTAFNTSTNLGSKIKFYMLRSLRFCWSNEHFISKAKFRIWAWVWG